MKRYPLLDYARLFLACAVVFNHFSGHKAFFQPVPPFLALSGFLIPASYAASRGWPHFAWKRICRLAPAFIVATGLVLIVGGFAGVTNMLQAYVTLGFVDSKYNGPVWSLGWEELAYGSLAVLYGIGAYKSRLALWACLAASILIPYLALDAYAVHAGYGVPVLAIGRLLPASFFAGNLCWKYADVIPRYRRRVFIAFVLASLLVVYPKTDQIIVYALFSASLVAMCVAFDRPLPKLPDLSYGIYLYHMPLGYIFASQGVSMAYSALVLPVFAYLSFRLVEQPALRLKDFRLRRKVVVLPLEVPEENLIVVPAQV